MDTKAAQKQLVGLITQHLSESIPVTRILTYKPDKNGSVSGRFESLNRVFNFVFNGNDVRYKPAMNADSALFSEYYLQRFDAAPATPRGTRALPKCTSKSYSCKGEKGVACITLTKGCKLETDDIGRERLNKIKKLSSDLADAVMFDFEPDPANQKKLADLEKSQAKIVEKRMALAVENRAKREPKKVTKVEPVVSPEKVEKVVAKVEPVKTPKPKKEKVEKAVKPVATPKPKEEIAEKAEQEKLPQGKRTDFAESWKGAWRKAPKDLQTILDALDQPERIDDPSSSSAYCAKDKGIHMHKYTPDATGRSNGVWRHEYGHWIDGELNNKVVGANSKNPFNELIEKHSNGKYKNEEDLSKGLQSNENDDFARDVKKKISKEVFGESDRFFSEIKNKLSKQDRKQSYLSDSPEGTKAFLSDEKLLLDKQKKSESKFEKTYDLEYEKYKDSISSWVKSQITTTGSKPSQARIGEHIEHLKLANAIKEEATARATKKGKKNLEKNIEAETSKIIEEKLKTSFAGKLMLSGSKDVEKLFFANTKRSIYNAIIDSENPVTLAKALEGGLKDSSGLAEDLIGSITTNKVGQGHSDEYYARSGESGREGQNVEAFANLISIYGSGHPLAEEALKALSPNGFAFMKKTLKDSAEMLKGAK